MTALPKASDTVIAVDLDGTFLSRTKGIPQRNLAAIERFTAVGGQFTVSTGRYGKKLRSLFPDMEKYVNAPAITCNEAFMFNVQTGEPIRRIYNRSDRYIPMLHEIYDTFGDEVDIQLVVDRDNIPTNIGFDRNDTTDYEIYKTLIVGDEDKVARVKEYISRIPHDFNVSNSAPVLLEIIDKAGTKGICVGELRRYYEARGEKKTMICVGDFENDLGMLREADIAACPENATPEVKAASDIFLCHCDDGAIGDLIERILGEQ